MPSLAPTASKAAPRIAALLLLAVTAGPAPAQQVSRAQMQQIRAVCEADVQRLCPGIQPGGGRLLQCLQQNAPEVSEPCTAKLAELGAMRPSN